MPLLRDNILLVFIEEHSTYPFLRDLLIALLRFRFRYTGVPKAKTPAKALTLAHEPESLFVMTCPPTVARVTTGRHTCRQVASSLSRIRTYMGRSHPDFESHVITMHLATCPPYPFWRTVWLPFWGDFLVALFEGHSNCPF